MNDDLSWMLDSALEIPGALHAVLISADGLLMARTKDFDKDNADRVAAAMSGVQSLSRSLAFFADNPGQRWQQTLVEFDGGWVFLISAGEGAYLGVSASQDIDMQDITFRMQQLVGQLGKFLAAPPRENLGAFQ
ncbi:MULTISPECIES: roadblock/LC7 domain-containing protein [Streptomycetaceae]|uniref:Roadblock/LC7 domain-containing protein n=1 Tax=Kitasatospora herbaricolor TaxID=68217 RepID=A0ABZ1W1S2_9ACTN|nr:MULTISPECIES: roadblock/LC7 domain-containing protein [Streptomycetaceae]MDQ0312849.1 putative regulator of Ras-like GTPase activity (Roadblock/LC7/MglB family) [Kitasatospora herbaricolor]OKI12626.1 dynein regulation protein LC7 [Streptomyces sp. CB03911]